MTASPTIQPPAKSEDAFRTIGELADELKLPQHILRYWETRFAQLRPLQRAGKRRYYRPSDVALVRRIDRLLNHEGYTIRGVQKLLDARTPDTLLGDAPVIPALPMPSPEPIPSESPVPETPAAAAPAMDSAPDFAALVAIRQILADGLAADTNVPTGF